MPIKVREYGSSGPWVIALHGGPTAVGDAAPIAQGLAASFRVLEPWQRGGGETPLTVDTHVEDLHELIVQRRIERPALVGHSWGAMLALAYAAKYPDQPGRIALIGCGTFDEESRRQMKANIEARTTPAMKRALELLAEISEPNERLRQRFEILNQIYYIDPIEEAEPTDDTPPFDERGHQETWSDMLALQSRGVYPAGFSAINSPGLMLHGADDPHPGRMIQENLAPQIRQLEYREWPRCGHSPWVERNVRANFFAVLTEWLRLPASSSCP